MAADSAAISGLQIAIRLDPKLFGLHNFLIGCAGSYRAMQLLRFGDGFRTPRPDEDPFAFMVNGFVPALRNVLKGGGHIIVENGYERTEATFLVAFHCHLFRVETDFQVAQVAEPFAALGCGEELMLGSLFSTSNMDNPKQRLELALQAAEHFSAGVRRPWIHGVTTIATSSN